MIGVLLLASGYSRRFGGHKLSTNYHGTALINHCLNTLTHTQLPVLAIVRPESEELHALLQQKNIPFHMNHHADKGLSSSIRCGIKHVQDQWQGCLIALADMPWVRVETYQTLAELLSPQNIIIPYTKAVPQSSGDTPHSQSVRMKGHPVGFGKVFFEQLSTLQGDTGARSVIQKNLLASLCVPLDDNGILIDIDKKSDLNIPRP